MSVLLSPIVISSPLDGRHGVPPGGVQVPRDQATHPLHRLVVIQQPVIPGNLEEIKKYIFLLKYAQLLDLFEANLEIFQ